MSTITTGTTAVPTTSVTRRLWPTVLVAGIGAAIATTVVAAIGRGIGASLDISGDPIPVLAFGEVTAMFVVIGFGIAVGLRRWTRNPRQTWLRTTVALTVLSFIPDLVADASIGTKATLMTTHLVAAAIVIPAVASRLSRR
ncbi:MAG TPA: DUF6069 family protein [Marmoricola sp.]|jgi:hypothetical protein|nr:DUF6069 family protein [Marmoricola sp.]